MNIKYIPVTMLFCFLFYLGFAIDLFVFDFTLPYSFEYFEHSDRKIDNLKTDFSLKILCYKALISLCRYCFILYTHIEILAVLVINIKSEVRLQIRDLISKLVLIDVP